MQKGADNCFSKVFCGEIQVAHLHKCTWKNPHFFPIWYLACSLIRCHSGHVLPACHCRWPRGQLSRTRGAPCPSLLQENFSFLAVCSFKISCWQRAPRHAQSKGILDNKAAADVFCKQAKFPLSSHVIKCTLTEREPVWKLQKQQTCKGRESPFSQISAQSGVYFCWSE